MKLINKNKGMYLETIVDNTIDYYNCNFIGIFRKQSLPIKIKSVNKKEVVGIIKNKADSDYYGLYKGKFIAIEAKETSLEFFDMKLIRKHQIIFLLDVIQNRGLSYLIVYFSKTEHFYLVDFQTLWDYIKTINKKRIYENWFSQNSFSLELFFPGWIDFIKKIKT